MLQSTGQKARLRPLPGHSAGQKVITGFYHCVGGWAGIIIKWRPPFKVEIVLCFRNPGRTKSKQVTCNFDRQISRYDFSMMAGAAHLRGRFAVRYKLFSRAWAKLHILRNCRQMRTALFDIIWPWVKIIGDRPISKLAVDHKLAKPYQTWQKQLF